MGALVILKGAQGKLLYEAKNATTIDPNYIAQLVHKTLELEPFLISLAEKQNDDMLRIILRIQRPENFIDFRSKF